MGRGRTLGRAVSSKVVPSKLLRWAPKPNAHARCVASKLKGQTGGGRLAAQTRFTQASKACK